MSTPSSPAQQRHHGAPQQSVWSDWWSSGRRQPCWTERMWADRRLQGGEGVRANQTARSKQAYEGGQGDSRQPDPASHVLVQPSWQPQWNSPSQHKWAKSWAHFDGFCPKPESLGIPQTSKRALHAFPKTNGLMLSWKTWIFAFYGFTMDYIQVTT